MDSLTGIKVVDLSRLLPGPFCSLILADLGADVIKVENPSGGDPIRGREPMAPAGQSTLYEILNRNKRSVALNLKSAEDRGALNQLIQHADVLIHGFRPGVMESWELGYDDLSRENPQLIYCGIIGYDRNSTYAGRAGHDLNYISLTGLLDTTGQPDGPPVIPGAQVADLTGATMAAVGILAALRSRDITGNGQNVEIALATCALSFMTYPWSHALGVVGDKRGASRLTGGLARYQVYETSDGRYLSVGALEHKFWVEFCCVVGHPEWIARESERMPQVQLIAEVRQLVKTRTLEEWSVIFDEHDACVTPVLTLQEVINRNRNENMAWDDMHAVTHPPFPIFMSRTPMHWARDAPKLGSSRIFDVINEWSRAT